MRVLPLRPSPSPRVLPAPSAQGPGWGALTAAKLALAPLLVAQGLHVRRRALQLPEAAGPREGEERPLAARRRRRDGLRLLVVGDSSAAGVGVADQRDALAATVARTLADELGRPVRWQLVARTGNTTLEALQQVREIDRLRPADILLTALGVNDVVRQVPPQRSLEQLEALHAEVRERSGARYWLHSALPPVHAFPLLPRPLRWVLGHQAEQLNQVLQQALGDRRDRGVRRLPAHLHECPAERGLMAADGFHPGAAGYAVWGEALGQFLARRWTRLERA